MPSGSNTTVQKADPWIKSQPFLESALEDANAVYDKGGFFVDPYSGPRVAGFGDMTRSAFGDIERLSGSGPDGSITGGKEFISGLYGGPSMPEGKAAGTLATLMGARQRGPGLGDARRAVDRITSGRGPGTNLSDSYLQSMMRGGWQSDQLDAAKEQALGSAVPAAVSQFAGSGMANSTAAMDTVGRAASEAVAPYEYGAMQQMMDRGMGAAGMQYGQQNAALNRALSGSALQFSEQDKLRRLSMDAANSALGQGNAADRTALAGAGLAPQLQAAGYLPAQMMMSAGGMQDAKSQQFLDADMARHYEREKAPMAELQDYSNLLWGYGGQGSSMTGGGSQSPGALGLLGGGLQMAGLTNMMFPSFFPALGAAFSDRRLKREIRIIGTTPAGTNVYTFKYLWSDAPQVGVMADEVPSAIIGQIGGFSVVDYTRVS